MDISTFNVCIQIAGTVIGTGALTVIVGYFRSINKNLSEINNRQIKTETKVEVHDKQIDEIFEIINRPLRIASK